MKYKKGQCLRTTEDIELRTMICEKPVKVKKGTLVYIGCEKTPFVHFGNVNGKMMSLWKNAELEEGFDTDGIARWLYEYLRVHFELDEMLGWYHGIKEDPEDLETFEEEKKRFLDEISYALDDLGL